MGQKPKKTNYSILVTILALALASLGAGLWVYQSSAGLPVAAEVAPQTQSPAADSVAYAASDFQDGQARHYSYKSPDGIEIRYFIIKSSDGIVRAAFDACDVCWRSNLGYTQEGDVMVCGNCGRRFPSVKVNEVEGGCNPAPLLRQAQGGQILIKVADILAGRRFFDFSS